MDEREHFEMCEAAAMANHVAACMEAILTAWCADTLGALQRKAYKHTDAGVSVSFRLDDGEYIWVGDPTAYDPTLVTRVAAIGVSSIVEGSDRDVPLVWVDLVEAESPQDALRQFHSRIHEVDEAACAIWHEEHADLEFEP